MYLKITAKAQFSWGFHKYFYLIFATTIQESEEKNYFPLSGTGRHNTSSQACDSRSHAHLIAAHRGSIQLVLCCVASTLWLAHPVNKTEYSPCPSVFMAWDINSYLQALSTFCWEGSGKLYCSKCLCSRPGSSAGGLYFPLC